MLSSFSLQGKTILLTGAAGLFGRGLATALAEAGATLIIASRSAENLQAVATAEIARGHRVHAEAFDQGDEDSILALRSRIESRFGPLHGLVNNSVLRPMKGTLGNVSQWEDSMRVNATGLMLMHRHFGSTMAEAGRGSIVNIGSIQGMIGPSYELYAGTSMGDMPPDYFFHKGGMLNLTRFYAALYGPKNVRVNCLAPGGFYNNQPELFVQRYSEHTMLNRMADDDDLGGAVVFLLSEASRYITGVNLPVDGGYTAK
ncbi:SDR family oxidoreductase [Prosthecobacter dejongeii]|uniref:NAD(P)-dependent dehydrogenase (Short-subunit alcohol dehydrogenase family) n=1 Tax=Prosthecobacter dejongeii TaxID=48465 RepID=A0A7W7YHW1_9BACT|nr:SDR family oxidoreductase [Prosthecobacter dejongeii]MBB5036481.1 NAD(P)-dependent dehydrogenase (short-subunit alcohol dehydrogenase family) [Prosthecobacter dejongeii]